MMKRNIGVLSLLLAACGPTVSDTSSSAGEGQSAGTQGPSPTGTGTGEATTADETGPTMRFDVARPKLDVRPDEPPTPPLGCCGGELPRCSDGFECGNGFCVSVCSTKATCPPLVDGELLGECRSAPGEINPPPPGCAYPCVQGACPDGFTCAPGDVCVPDGCER